MRLGSRERLASRHGLLAGVAVACALAAPLGVAAEVKFSGTWECDAAPKVNVPNFSAPASATRDGERLTVWRVVYKAGTFEEIGRLTGSGQVANGRVLLQVASERKGAAPTDKPGITGQFEGTVSATEIALEGKESVSIADRGQDERTCRVRLNKR
jgi:hypothetical protein